MDEEEEEVSAAALVAFVGLLSHIIAKDFLDFSDEAADALPASATAEQRAQVATRAAAEARDVAQTASRVVFFGLQQLLPLVTPELLQFPLLCTRLFVLIAFMVEVYPDKLRELEPGLFAALMSCLDFGARHVNDDVARNSLQAVAEMAAFHAKAATARRTRAAPDAVTAGLGDHGVEALRHFMQLILQLVVNEQVSCAFAFVATAAAAATGTRALNSCCVSSLRSPFLSLPFPRLASYRMRGWTSAPMRCWHSSCATRSASRSTQRPFWRSTPSWAARRGGIASRLPPAGWEERYERDRLAAALTRLTTSNGLTPELNRPNRQRFKSNMRAFVVEVRGFIQTK